MLYYTMGYLRSYKMSSALLDDYGEGIASWQFLVFLCHHRQLPIFNGFLVDSMARISPASETDGHGLTKFSSPGPGRHCLPHGCATHHFTAPHVAPPLREVEQHHSFEGFTYTVDARSSNRFRAGTTWSVVPAGQQVAAFRRPQAVVGDRWIKGVTRACSTCRSRNIS